MSTAQPSPISAAIAHAEPAFEKARVLVLDSALGPVPQLVLGRGARLCHVLDPDPKRVAQAAQLPHDRRVSYSQLQEGGPREGGYDVVVVPNLGALERPLEVFEGIRRSLVSEGIAIVAIPNPKGSSGLLAATPATVSYGTLQAQAKKAFARVVMAAQTPFVGYGVVHLDLTAPPEPVLDNGLLGEQADQADFYIAFCGSVEAIEELDLNDMTVVQLPGAETLAVGRQALEGQVLRAERRMLALGEELDELRKQPVLTDALRAAEQALIDEQKKSRAEHDRSTSVARKVEDLEKQVARLAQELSEKPQAPVIDQAALVELRERLDAAEREVERSKKERKWAEDRVRRLERELEEALLAQEELDKAQERIATLQGHLKESEDECDSLTTKVSDLEDQLQALQAQANNPALEADIARLEGVLAERGQTVLRLEKELEQMARHFRTLETERNWPAPSPAPGDAPAGAQLESLGRVLAQKEADLVTAQWTISELKQKLAETSQPGA
jgi:DNA repair exonuclease SbcCD ATPase subunit